VVLGESTQQEAADAETCRPAPNMQISKFGRCRSFCRSITSVALRRDGGISQRQGFGLEIEVDDQLELVGCQHRLSRSEDQTVADAPLSHSVAAIAEQWQLEEEILIVGP